METQSKINNDTYEVNDVRYVYNTKQAHLFIKHGSKLIDCFAGCDTLVFVFDKKETKPLMDLWMKRELK